MLTQRRPGTDYLGVTFSLTKRLSNRWRLAGHFTWSDWDWKVGSGFRNTKIRPTRRRTTGTGAARTATSPSPSSRRAPATRGTCGLGSSYSFSLNTLYQVAPDKNWGFNVGASLTGREGFVSPPYAPASGGRRVQLGRFDHFRNDDILMLDARIDKDFEFGNDFGLTLSVDAFNLLNEDYVLQRFRNVDSGANANQVKEVLSPRVFRLGRQAALPLGPTGQILPAPGEAPPGAGFFVRLIAGAGAHRKALSPRSRLALHTRTCDHPHFLSPRPGKRGARIECMVVGVRIRGGRLAAALAVLAAVQLSASRLEAAPAARPDVLLITIDTLRADALGFAGNTAVETPVLDRLAAAGRVFTAPTRTTWSRCRRTPTS